jgi:hypothetical protein
MDWWGVGQVVIIPLRVNVNLKCITSEELIRRKFVSLDANGWDG